MLFRSKTRGSIGYKALRLPWPSNRETVLEHEVRLCHGAAMKIRERERDSEKKRELGRRRNRLRLSLLLPGHPSHEVNPTFHCDVYDLERVYTLCRSMSRNDAASLPDAYICWQPQAGHSARPPTSRPGAAVPQFNSLHSFQPFFDTLCDPILVHAMPPPFH